jgi:hypothetical protein
VEPKHEDIDSLLVMDRVLSAALREVRTARARLPVAEPSTWPDLPDSSSRKSQTALCINILKEAGRPLHVGALLDALEARSIHATRESLVSAISKKFAPLGPFVRTAPNTFGLAGRDTQEG